VHIAENFFRKQDDAYGMIMPDGVLLSNAKPGGEIFDFLQREHGITEMFSGIEASLTMRGR